MTAPSAPVIRCHSDGDKVYVRWQPVVDATDYKLYVADTTAPTDLEADISDDGETLFQHVFLSAGQTYVRLTALNLAAEESDYSNERHLVLTGPGRSFGTDAPPFG